MNQKSTQQTQQENVLFCLFVVVLFDSIRMQIGRIARLTQVRCARARLVGP